MEGMRNEYHRYDIIEAEIKMTPPSGSVQKKKPYVIVGNEKGTTTAPTVIAMPLTHIIKRTGLPTHGCISANSDTGLSLYSMVLGEQPYTLDKKCEIKRKLGAVVDKEQRNIVNKVCWNTMFFGENINWEEVLA